MICVAQCVEMGLLPGMRTVMMGRMMMKVVKQLHVLGNYQGLVVQSLPLINSQSAHQFVEMDTND